MTTKATNNPLFVMLALSRVRGMLLAASNAEGATISPDLAKLFKFGADDLEAITNFLIAASTPPGGQTNDKGGVLQ